MLLGTDSQQIHLLGIYLNRGAKFPLGCHVTLEPRAPKVAHWTNAGQLCQLAQFKTPVLGGCMLKAKRRHDFSALTDWKKFPKQKMSYTLHIW